MSEKTSPKPNTRGLIASAQRKSQEARQRAHQVIDQLLREQQPINFNTVAREAQVTKSYLYAHLDVRDRIEALRAQQNQEKLQKRRAESHQQGRTDKSKDVLLAAKDRRIKELEEQNRKLKEELKVAYGKLYENV
jgi:PHD/YefM family antitoxin component YafN of YafNO toxin-antitoxin module